MKPVIKTEDLTKYYGKIRGVEALDLEVKKGEIFGFLGPNGAGKTTTIRLLLHLINPTSGEISVFGKDVKENYPEVLRDIGYLPGDFNLYEKMSGKALLKFSSSFYGRKVSSNFTEEVIEKLDCDLSAPFKNLSKGNKQKIGILLAIFHKPKLLVLDEPTAGLDPLMQNDFYEILLNLKKEGVTIFFSSHNLPEVEKICDRVGIIREGNLVDVETIAELRAHRKKVVEIYFESDFQKEDFAEISGIEIIRAENKYLYLYAKNSAINPLLKVLTNYRVKDIDFSYPDLEKVFLEYYKKVQ